MKKTNKKGFTIVELVIVIAVIAILAAVLIPTFSGIIKKAKINADTQVARNLNTSLAADTALNGKPQTIEDVLKILKADGYLIENLNSKSGCYYVWEKDTNQILLVDTDYSVKYSAKDGYGAIDDSWHFAISNETVAATVRSAQPNAIVFRAMTNAEDLNTTLSAGGVETLYLDESIVLTNTTTISVTNSNADITIKMNGSSLATEGTLTSKPVYVAEGKLTIEDAIVGGAGQGTTEYGTFTTAVGFDAGSTLILNNCSITGRGNAITGSWDEDGDCYVELNNCNLFSDAYGFNFSTWGRGVLNNTNITCPNPIEASFGAQLTVNGGTYKSTTSDGYLLTLYRQQSVPDSIEFATITITAGDFTFTNFVNFATTNTKVVITGGTFNNVNYLEYFENIATIGGGTVSINGTTVTIQK